MWDHEVKVTAVQNQSRQEKSYERLISPNVQLTCLKRSSLGFFFFYMIICLYAFSLHFQQICIKSHAALAASGSGSHCTDSNHLDYFNTEEKLNLMIMN